MLTFSKTMVVAFVAASASLASAGMSSAQEATFNMGNVTVAYADGYIDRNQQFHDWDHRADAEQYRAKNPDHYRSWRHDDPRHHDVNDNR
jgi:hypothetical protein